MKNSQKGFSKIGLILGIIVILVIIGITINISVPKSDKSLAVLGKDKASDLLSISEIKSICLSTSSTIKEGVLDYKEKSNSTSDEFWQWNPTVIEDATKIFENEKGPLIIFDVSTFNSKEEAMSKYNESLKSFEVGLKISNPPRELTIGDKSFIIFWSEGYGTDAQPKNKANDLIFIKGNHMVLLRDVLGNIIPETPLNCTQEQLIQLGELIEKKI